MIDILAVILDDFNQGISEHELLKLLQNPPYSLFTADALKDPLVLFQTHFLLFHCLYRLRNQYLKQGTGDLEISALKIFKKPLINKNTRSERVLDEFDPLAQYYLDGSHFTTTKGEDVEALLNGFWKKMYTQPAGVDIQQALLTMELDEPIPLADLKVQYRRLANRHHPDKGGDSEEFKKVCLAFQQLKQHCLV